MSPTTTTTTTTTGTISNGSVIATTPIMGTILENVRKVFSVNLNSALLPSTSSSSSSSVWDVNKFSSQCDIKHDVTNDAIHNVNEGEEVRGSIPESDTSLSGEGSPVVAKGEAAASDYAGCGAAFPGVVPRMYEAKEWSSKESVPYLFCNDVKHYKPMRRSDASGNGGGMCESTGNRSVGIIIPSSSLVDGGGGGGNNNNNNGGGGAADGMNGDDDLIELVCTIDEINFIRRNHSVQPQSMIRKINLPKIAPLNP